MMSAHDTAVPAEDSASDVTTRDVIGKKSDTTSGDSLVALVKIADAAIDVVDGYHDVPTKDTTDNNQMRDVIGNKDDRVTAAGAADTSIYAVLYGLYLHIHKPQKVEPTLADGVTITGSESAWTLGAFAEVIAANKITSAFDIHYVNVEAASANDVYEIVLYAVEVEIGRCRFTKTAARDIQEGVPIQVPIIAPNTQIKAKVASASGGSDTVTISLCYHEY